MSRHPRILRTDPGQFRPWLDSFQLSLQAAGLSARTVFTYVDAGALLGSWLSAHAPDVDDWDGVGREELRHFFVWIQHGGAPCPHQLDRAAKTPPQCDGYERGYANNLGRSLQQFFAWFATEEDLPNPMLGFRVPAALKMGEKLVPILSPEDLAALIQEAERGRDFISRRDTAVLRLFASTGVRLKELTRIALDDLDISRREIIVTGKGGRQRTPKFDSRAALALDRYLRARRKRLEQRTTHKGDIVALWIGERRAEPMTESGVYQLIAKRGAALGIKLHPHMFRHTFTHRWLDAGGAEGDLMELNGWDSPQMLRHYGATARAARARRAYDRVNVMGNI